MKKVFKIISKVLLALSIVAYGASFIIPGITMNVTDLAYLAQLIMNVAIVVCAIVGAILIYSSKETAQRVGHGLTISSFIVALATALMYIGIKSTTETGTSTASKTVSSTAAIVMIVAAAFLAAYYVLQFILIILNKGATESCNPSEDLRIIRIKEWKQILDEGIITQEEFEEKRIQILGLKPKQTK